MGIVEDIYRKNINISELELAAEILQHKELDILDLWLLPQYPFDQWRRKYDYPNLLENIKRNQSDFKIWMEDQGITEDYLLNGYFSAFFEKKPLSDDKRKYLVRVSYKGQVSIQAWHSYDGQTSMEGDGEPVLYEFIKDFISYYDWKFLRDKKDFNFINTFHRYYPNTSDEQVYLNHNIRLLKMGGIRPPVNGVGIMLRGKKLEFINASGLTLSGTIYWGTMGTLSFDHCTVDNLVCNELNMPNLFFENSTINNLQIRNSQIQQWKFITSFTTGNIIDSKLTTIDIYGGQFIPTFTNSEIDNVDVHQQGVTHSREFEKTYRTLSKSAKDSGNYRLAKRFKINEFDFIKAKKKGLRRYLMTLDKLYWSYGQEPERLIWITLGTIFTFGVIYSFFPQNFKGLDLTSKPYYQVLFNLEYYSAVTFTTLGYGDISPLGFLKFFAAIEAVFGSITLGFLISGLTRKD